jgi:uncharacterized membrane protein YcaP (DUF421 family)
VTLVFLDVALSLIKQRFPSVDAVLEGKAVIIVEDGKPLKERLRQERLDEQDILEAARELRGLERMDQIKYAVLERSGHISIIPYR